MWLSGEVTEHGFGSDNGGKVVEATSLSTPSHFHTPLPGPNAHTGALLWCIMLSSFLHCKHMLLEKDLMTKTNK